MTIGPLLNDLLVFEFHQASHSKSEQLRVEKNSNCVFGLERLKIVCIT